jgi:hypothetical protein
VYAEEALNLDAAINDATVNLAGRIKTGSMVVVIGLDSPDKGLSNYIMEKIIDHLITTDQMKVVDRQRPDLIQAEMDRQMSDYADPKYAHSLGKQFSADYIISGSFKQQGGIYELRLVAINAETAQIQGTTTKTVQMDTKLAALLKSNWTDPDAWKNKKIYFGFRAGVTLQTFDVKGGYNSSGDPSETKRYGILPNLGAEIAYQIKDIFALQTEVYFQYFSGYIEWDDYTTHFDITIPILAKATFKPAIFSLETFAGPALNFIINDPSIDVPAFNIGLILGGNAGVKAGNGILFLDIRDQIEFQEVELHSDDEKGIRNNFSISVGYKFGMVDKK